MPILITLLLVTLVRNFLTTELRSITRMKYYMDDEVSEFLIGVTNRKPCAET